MKLVGSGEQSKFHPLYDASGTITTGGTSQLVLPQVPSRSVLIIQNNSSSGSLWFEFGSARAKATITSGAVSAITVTNGGKGFTYPPVVRFAGGGYAGNTAYLGLNQPGGEGPNSSIVSGRPAKAHAVLTGGVVTSIVIDDPGAGYVIAPYVYIFNSDLDPYGGADPFYSSTTTGIQIAASGGSLYINGTACPTDSIYVYGATTGQQYIVKWMT